ncbi:MAG: S-layer homology domain-containing protein [Oscillospiraceae bacterium]
MAWAVERGLICGIDGKLSPKGTASRAQFATVIMRFCEKFWENQASN